MEVRELSELVRDEVAVEFEFFDFLLGDLSVLRVFSVLSRDPSQPRLLSLSEPVGFVRVRVRGPTVGVGSGTAVPSGDQSGRESRPVVATSTVVVRAANVSDPARHSILNEMSPLHFWTGVSRCPQFVDRRGCRRCSEDSSTVKTVTRGTDL